MYTVQYVLPSLCTYILALDFQQHLFEFEFLRLAVSKHLLYSSEVLQHSANQMQHFEEEPDDRVIWFLLQVLWRFV